MTGELVALERDACPVCGCELVRYSVGQPALFVHAGYGATEVTAHRWCPDCGWRITPDVATETPRQRAGTRTGPVHLPPARG